MATYRKMTAAERAHRRAIASRALRRAQEIEQEVEEQDEDEEQPAEVEARRAAARRRAAMRRRATARRTRSAECGKMPKKSEAEDEVEEKSDDMAKRLEEARRIANRKRAMFAARKRAQEVKKDEETEDEKPTKGEPAADIQPDEEEKKEARRRAAKRAFARNRAAMRKRSAEGSDDLVPVDGDSSNIEELHNGDTMSDDLTITDEEKGGVQQTPPATVNEAEDKVIAAYNLIEKQIAQNVISAGVRKASLAAEYVKKYSAKEMKFAAEQLANVGAAGKTAGNVRVTKRSGLPTVKSASIKKADGIDEQCLFA